MLIDQGSVILDNRMGLLLWTSWFDCFLLRFVIGWVGVIGSLGVVGISCCLLLGILVGLVCICFRIGLLFYCLWCLCLLDFSRKLVHLSLSDSSYVGLAILPVWIHITILTNINYHLLFRNCSQLISILSPSVWDPFYLVNISWWH